MCVQANEEIHNLEKRFSQIKNDFGESQQELERANHRLEEKEAAVKSVSFDYN